MIHIKKKDKKKCAYERGAVDERAVELCCHTEVCRRLLHQCLYFCTHIFLKRIRKLSTCDFNTAAVVYEEVAGFEVAMYLVTCVHEGHAFRKKGYSAYYYSLYCSLYSRS
jgi:hypothetical protein